MTGSSSRSDKVAWNRLDSISIFRKRGSEGTLVSEIAPLGPIN